MQGVTWNLWHGCHRFSEGCRNCYVYRGDFKRGLDAEKIYKTSAFELPIKKRRDGSYKIAGGQTVWTCFTSDFLLEDADGWRPEAFAMIRARPDLHFMFITKRILRFESCMPGDWKDGWDNVTVGCTVENALEAGRRLPVFVRLPIKHRIIICEPLLGPIDLSPYLGGGIEQVIAGGESGRKARICDFEWIKALERQCRRANVTFRFKQTGSYLKKDGTVYAIERPFQHSQAYKANIDFTAPGACCRTLCPGRDNVGAAKTQANND